MYQFAKMQKVFQKNNKKTEISRFGFSAQSDMSLSDYLLYSISRARR